MQADRPPRVLVVDDEKHIRGMLRDLLTTWGYQADVAASSSEALTLFQQGGYDLVLTDLLMPGGSGLELVQHVRDADQKVGVIVFTGSGADLEVDSLRFGFTPLRKPLQLGRLQAAVKDLVSAGRRAARA
ncbi:MAG: response regulator [Candidatus Rokuibacteriota bacterium]